MPDENSWDAQTVQPKRVSGHTLSRLQQEVFKCLLSGGSIVYQGNSGYRVRDAAVMPVVRIRSKSFEQIKLFLRKQKDGTWRINRSEIIKLRGSRLEKKIYKSLKTKNEKQS